MDTMYGYSARSRVKDVYEPPTLELCHIRTKVQEIVSLSISSGNYCADCMMETQKSKSVYDAQRHWNNSTALRVQNRSRYSFSHIARQ